MLLKPYRILSPVLIFEPRRRLPTGNQPGHGKSQHLRGTRLLERPCAGIQRRASRHYIIYQQNAQVVNLCAVRR